MNKKVKNFTKQSTSKSKPKLGLASVGLFSTLFTCSILYSSSTIAEVTKAVVKSNEVLSVKQQSYNSPFKHSYKKLHMYVDDDSASISDEDSDSSNSSNSGDMYIFRQHCPGPDVKIYVKHGATGGDGSKDSPYGSLDEAEAATGWTKLVIIPTEQPLVGNILLQDCQSIRGIGTNPVTANPDMKVATIKGAAGERDVIRLRGNHSINNIRILDADRSAINLDGMENVIIKNVHVANANKGDYIDSIACLGFFAGFPTGLEASAISTECISDKNGELIIKNSLIEGSIGAGVTVSVLGIGFAPETGPFFLETSRTTTILNTKIKNMSATKKDKSSFVLLSNVPSSAGVNIIVGGSSSHQLDVDDVKIKDILAEGVPIIPSPPPNEPQFTFGNAAGINTEVLSIDTCAVEGFPPEFCNPGFSSLLATSSVDVKNSTIKNIRGGEPGILDGGIFVFAGSSGINNATFSFKNNIFNGARDGLILFAPSDFFAGNTVNMTFKNNIVKNTSESLGLLIGGSGSGHINVDIIGNKFKNIGSDPIELIGAEQFFGFKTFTATIKDNKINHYGFSTLPRPFPFGAIVNFNSFGTVPSPDFPFAGIIDFFPLGVPPSVFGGWASFESKIENNCIKNGPVGIVEYFGAGLIPGTNDILDAGGGPLGSVGNNSFVNMTQDIVQFESQVFARENYWGGGDATLFEDSEADTNNFLTEDPCDDSDSSDSISDNSSS